MTVVRLPTLHADQVRCFHGRSRRYAVRCGRRWGKTVFDETWLADGAVKGAPCGWFAPDYKKLSEAYNDLHNILEPIKTNSSKTEGVIRTATGGRIDFWTLEDENAGRSRHYKRIVIDEGAFTKPNMLDIWERSIEPTLLDFSGAALVTSNTNGNDPTNFLYAIYPQPGETISRYGFTGFHAPSRNNPLLPFRKPDEDEVAYQLRRAAAFDKIKAEKPPLVYSQEYEAEFVDWSGVSFFAKDKLLVGGEPVETPSVVDTVIAVIDCASKTEKENDGTAVIYLGLSQFSGHPCVILDWDLQQIEGAMLEVWLPTVFQNLEALARRCNARMGSTGAFIEDKDSGVVLLQKAANNGWPAHAIPSKLTAVGKDARAISISGHHYQGKIKICREAYDKVTTFKGTTRNHLLAQIVNFRVGDKDAARRADDCLDVYTYGVALTLGNDEGF